MEGVLSDVADYLALTGSNPRPPGNVDTNLEGIALKQSLEIAFWKRQQDPPKHRVISLPYSSGTRSTRFRGIERQAHREQRRGLGAEGRALERPRERRTTPLSEVNSKGQRRTVRARRRQELGRRSGGSR